MVSACYFVVSGLKCFYLCNLSQARETKLFHLLGLFLMFPDIYSVKADSIQDKEKELCL